MRGHWIGNTRKMNKHWQSGEDSIKEYSRWFTTIKYEDDYYCFAPSYAFEEFSGIEFRDTYIHGNIYSQLKNTWTDFGTVTLTPSFNSNMNVSGSYTLEDMRENATVYTRTLTASDRVKVIIPTFKLSVNFYGGNDFVTGYKYTSTPSIPTGAEILWQDNNDLLSYESRYSDSLNIVRNTWNAWETDRVYEGHTILQLKEYLDAWTSYTDPDFLYTKFTLGYYDHNTSSSGVPTAVNLLSPVMNQCYSNTDYNLIMPFNDYLLFSANYRDYGDNILYSVLLRWRLVSLALTERTII